MATADDQRATNQVDEKSLTHIRFLIVRKSPVFLTIQLLLLELGFFVVFLFLQLPSLNQTTLSAGNSGFLSLMAILTLVGLILKISLMLIVILRWESEYYEIHAKEIVHRKGIFAKHHFIFATADVKSITVDQNLLGRIFHYGSIKLYSPALGTNIIIANVANPNKCVEVVSQLLPQIQKQDIYLRAGSGIGTG